MPVFAPRAAKHRRGYETLSGTLQAEFDKRCLKTAGQQGIPTEFDRGQYHESP